MTRFDVDTNGFRNQMASRDFFRILQEPIANSFDEKTVKKIMFEIKSIGQEIRVSIYDDGAGFKNPSDAYTLFGHSERLADPELRGRYQLGEKMFFALAVKAIIETAGRHIEFDGDTRKEAPAPKSKGTKIWAWFSIKDNKTIDEAIKKLNLLIVPKSKILMINGVPLLAQKPIRKFMGVLTTIQPQKSNPRVMQHVNRMTSIRLYQPNGQGSWLYELGVPVCKIDCLWSISVEQKIPQNPNRDTVSDSYLKKLYGIIVNNAYNLIPKEEAGNNFVTLGLGGATTASAKDILSKRFESKSVVLRSADYRANEAAMEDGAFVVPDGVFDTDTRKHLKEIKVANYASELYKTEFVAARSVPVTSEMQRFARFVNEIALDTIGQKVSCEFITAESDTLAQYSRATGTMTFNVGHTNVRKAKWFAAPSVANLGTVIHELSHDDSESDTHLAHLTTDYVHELERIGATGMLKGAQYYWDKSA